MNFDKTWIPPQGISPSVCPACCARKTRLLDPPDFIIGIFKDGVCDRCGFRQKDDEDQSRDQK